MQRNNQPRSYKCRSHALEETLEQEESKEKLAKI